MAENKNTFHDHNISWQTPEFVQHEKGAVWFVIAGALMLVLIISAIIAGNWTLVVALVLGSALYVWQHGQSPKHVDVLISKTGIKVGNKQYLYQNIKNFWIIYHPPHVKTLNLKSNSKTLNDISIEIEDIDPAELRTFLCGYVREDEGKEESLWDIFARLLKI